MTRRALTEGLGSFLLSGEKLLRYLVFALIGIQSVYWLTLLTAPTPLPLRITQAESQSRPVTYSWRLFAIPELSTQLPAFQILGVIDVPNSNDARAAVMVAGEKKVVAIGEEMSPGLVLESVNQAGITVQFRGQSHTFLLPSKAPRSPAANPGVAPQLPPAPLPQ